jgi:hypothetical protein
MIHTISGNNFHGTYSVSVRAPAAGGVLSRKVARKVRAALCDYEGCQCGGRYGDGSDADSATIDDTIDNHGVDVMYVVPAIAA